MPDPSPQDAPAAPAAPPVPVSLVPVPPAPVARPRTRAKPEVVSHRDKMLLYGFFALVVMIVGLMQWKEARSEAANHQHAIRVAESEFDNNKLSQANYLEVTTSEAMITDLSSLRHAGLFFGVVALALGCMLVMTGIESGYQLSLDGPQVKGTLNATSPGLVLITLGVALAIVSLYRNTSITIHPDDGGGSASIAAHDMPPSVSSLPSPPTTPVDHPGAMLAGSGAPR